MLKEASQHDMSKNLAGYRKKGDSSVVAADRLIPFFLVNGYDNWLKLFGAPTISLEQLTLKLSTFAHR